MVTFGTTSRIKHFPLHGSRDNKNGFASIHTVAHTSASDGSIEPREIPPNQRELTL